MNKRKKKNMELKNKKKYLKAKRSEKVNNKNMEKMKS